MKLWPGALGAHSRNKTDEQGRERLAWRQLVSKGLDLVIPPRCACCGQAVNDANHLCGACWSKMEWIGRPFCSVSGLPFAFDLGEEMVSPSVMVDPPVYDRARSVAAFGDTARRLVHQLKYYDRADLASVMGQWMVRAGADCLNDRDCWIVPVPLYITRMWKRRFNQSALLAQAIAKQSGTAYKPALLRRVRSTRQQVGLSQADRRSNVEGAFQLHLPDRLSLSGRTIVLIDDVWTTGATLEACCRVLRRAEAGEICIITFARVVDGEQMPI